MPWRAVLPMDEKIRFIQTYRAGVFNFTELCAFFGISCKTGYKWVERWKAEGREGLEDRSHASVVSPQDAAGCSGRALDYPPQASQLGAGEAVADPSQAATIPASPRSIDDRRVVQAARAGEATAPAATSRPSRPWSDAA